MYWRNVLLFGLSLSFLIKTFSRKGYRYDSRYLQIMYIFFFYSASYSDSDKGKDLMSIDKKIDKLKDKKEKLMILLCEIGTKLI